MKIKKYTNGAWTDLDKPVKKYATYTDEATAVPLTIQTSATDAVENYEVFGASSGVGEETENLFDKNAKDTDNGYVRWHTIISTGAVVQDSSWDVTEYINVKPSTVYTASNCVDVGASICFYDTNKEYISGIPYNSPRPGGYGTLTFTTPNNCAYARTCVLTANQSGSGYEFERNVDVFMITEGSTAPTSYIPYGYKIPILLESGVTENLWNYTTQPLSGNGYLYNGSINLPAGTYTLRADLIRGNTNMSFAVVDNQGNTVYNASIINHDPRTFMSDYNMTQLRFYVSNTVDELYLTLVKGSTAPDHYIPHRYTSNYDLFIGSTKLGEEEYVDYEEQKVYRYVDGVLVPQDPPAPLPPIPTYKGENNLSVDTTVQPEKVAVEYEGWKGVGDVEKYQNGEWSDNNGT